MDLIDKISIDFKHTGFGEYPLEYQQLKSEKQNNFDVTVSYNGSSIKESYAVGDFDLQGRKLTDHETELLKIDILNKIVIDFYVPDTFKDFMLLNKYDSNPMNVKYLKTIYADIVSQSKKLASLFTDEDIEHLKIDLIEWRYKSPHASLVDFDVKEKELLN
jgi:hypothetical protein